MKLLLLAYEFPPSPSPQSLRWAYLCRELDALGHEVHVLAPDIAGFGPGGLPDFGVRTTVHRTFAGPVLGLAAGSARRHRAAAPSHADAADRMLDAPVQPPAREQLNWKGKVWHAGLNWKGRAYEQVKRVVSFLTFPDVRGEWERWARPRLEALLDELGPDVVISSHEPATTLSLGLRARRKGYPWVADLGDPVLAPYTEKRWRTRAFSLERETCREADAVILTADGARQLLAQRHQLAADRSLVLTQGFDGRIPPGAPEEGQDVLELLYTGSFYSFRRPDDLLEAVVATPGVRLSVATSNAPDALLRVAASNPDKVRLLGFMAHDASLALQRASHVLVNISNDSPVQVPGKVYEYLGAGRPVLHIRGKARDAAEDLLAGLSRGRFCEPGADAIARELVVLRDLMREGRLDRQFGLETDAVREFAWSSLAGRLSDRLSSIASRRRFTPDGVSEIKLQHG